MKITVIGPGAMGLLFGGKLAACAEVSLIGSNPENLKEINKSGVTIKRGDSSVTRKIPAYPGGSCKEPADVVLLFTKAYQIRDVLRENQAIIGPDTLLLTLQNGAGHDRVMREFADSAHVLIGTTKQGSSRESASVIINSGLGETFLGALPLRENRSRTKRGWRSFAVCSRVRDSLVPSATISALRYGIS